MTTVASAKGPIDSSSLGRVLMHEHVFIISPEMQHNVPEDWGDEEMRLADATQRLTELKQAGIAAVLTPGATSAQIVSEVAAALAAAHA